MATHIMALTYKPKIEAVKSLECRQTIRLLNPVRPKKVGDNFILHTWAGKPYRSGWDWRLNGSFKEITLLEPLPNGQCYISQDGKVWHHDKTSLLMRIFDQDWFELGEKDPATRAQKFVAFGGHTMRERPVYQILRW